MVAAKRVQAVLPDRAVAVAVINKTSKKGILREAIKQLTQTLHEHQPLLTSDYRLTKKSNTANTSSLQSLTKAALLLPGLLSTTPHAAEGDEVNFQYSHFQEGNRNVYGVVPNFTTGTESVSSIPTGLKPPKHWKAPEPAPPPPGKTPTAATSTWWYPHAPMMPPAARAGITPSTRLWAAKRTK